MRVLCRHGHFAFYPQARDEVLRMKRVLGLELVAEDDYYTMEGLAGLPRWSQFGVPYPLFPPGPTALFTYEGRHAWEVMRENLLVYSLATGLLVPYLSVTQVVALPQSRDYCVAPKLLVQPGAKLIGGLIPGNILLGYRGTIDLNIQRLYIDSLETLL